MSRHVLALNGGSSSLKFALYVSESGQLTRTLDGAAEGLDRPEGRFWSRSADGKKDELLRCFGTVDEALRLVLNRLASAHGGKLDAIGHRLVHGGAKHFEPAWLTDALFTSLEGCVPFAPLHLPAELELVKAMRKRQPETPQVVCFDTEFHQTLPEVARRFALPREVTNEGIHRYGFHGLSCAYVVQQLGAPMLGRAVIAHLGSGASVTAIRDGKSVDTTMGLTPTGGVMMGTRPGDLDPGVILYLANRGMAPDALSVLLNERSGLRGISESTSDVKALWDAREKDPKARLALDMFAYQVRKAIGGFAAVLGGLDTLVFTGGVGEAAAGLREQICSGLEYLGGVNVRVVATDEAWMIAQATARLVLGGEA